MVNYENKLYITVAHDAYLKEMPTGFEKDKTYLSDLFSIVFNDKFIGDLIKEGKGEKMFCKRLGLQMDTL